MITKRQAQHLTHLIEQYAEARENEYWQNDQGWVGSEIAQAKADRETAEAKVKKYVNGLVAD